MQLKLMKTDEDTESKGTFLWTIRVTTGVLLMVFYGW